MLGLGARRLAEHLLPALQRIAGDIEITRTQHSAIPRPLLRLLSCLRQDARTGTLLVLGDIPLRYSGKQVVFVQNAHLIPNSETPSRPQQIKNLVSRYLFKRNIRFADALIVQTEHMRAAIEEHYPTTRGKISIARQPTACVDGTTRREWRGGKLRLCYPAAPYPHKNHAILTSAMQLAGSHGLVEDIATTLDGERPSGDVAAMYSAADALVFPSFTESYGLPLVEAMTIGMPIVAADRPYARELCGAAGIYFDPLCPEALVVALRHLKSRLDDGWTPDWSTQLAALPKDWDDAAYAFWRVIQRDQEPSDERQRLPQTRPGEETQREWALSR
ncbi:glycosyltransferase [Sphingomonas hankookensis]|uniref:glycosyltransferase n=1 Tax=Sphingomonas hankookensis TaxID=563996 RepID=UPI001E30E40D|nr:glycosyltransferase [Sphingomonas hankookensis]